MLLQSPEKDTRDFFVYAGMALQIGELVNGEPLYRMWISEVYLIPA
jgi:hypothetical protein